MSEAWHNPLLPSNQSRIEAALSRAPDGRLAPEIIATLWDAGACPAALLPWLAWSLRVAAWDDVWPEPTKRAAIESSLAEHRIKGTRSAVRIALERFGFEPEISEWWEQSPAGEPYTFDVICWINDLLQSASGPVDVDLFQPLYRAIDDSKNTRSHYRLRIGVSTSAGLAIAAIVRQLPTIHATFETP